LEFSIKPQTVTEYLHEAPILVITGFKRSGKSILAEALYERLPDFGYMTVLQNAKSWIHVQHPLAAGKARTSTKIDPEIVSIINRFMGKDGKKCWIVDDAEVLLAHATEEMLMNLGQKIREQQFYLILIRNRFILEDSGWLRERELLISATFNKIEMKPFRHEEATVTASGFFTGLEKQANSEWLVNMSGGIPGLMEDLHLYAKSQWRKGVIGYKFNKLIIRKREELLLSKPIRQNLIEALNKRVLPPYFFLSAQAKAELGIFLHTGLISMDYFERHPPFNGIFWALVSRQRSGIRMNTLSYEDMGLNLEILIREAGLIESVCGVCNVDASDEGQLGRSLANILICQNRYPQIVNTIDFFLLEFFGKIGLIKLLKSRKVKTSISESADILVKQVLELSRQ